SGVSFFALLPASAGLRLERLALGSSSVTLFLQSTTATASCPLCGALSDRIHSHYQRRLADLPWRGRAVRLCLSVRRLFCPEPSRSRRIFADRFPTLAEVRARTTTELDYTHQQIGFALGGAAGARLAQRLGMATSPDTLLRRIRHTVLPDP